MLDYLFILKNKSPSTISVGLIYFQDLENFKARRLLHKFNYRNGFRFKESVL
jgi:hypothetical protein